MFAFCQEMAYITDASLRSSIIQSQLTQLMFSSGFETTLLEKKVLLHVCPLGFVRQPNQKATGAKKKKTARWHLHEEEERRWECKLNLSQKVSTHIQFSSFIKCAQWLSCFVTGDSSPAARRQILTEPRHNEQILVLNWTLHYKPHHCQGGFRCVYMQKTWQTSGKVYSNNTGTRLTLEQQTATHDGDHQKPYEAPLSWGGLWRLAWTTTHAVTRNCLRVTLSAFPANKHDDFQLNLATN